MSIKNREEANKYYQLLNSLVDDYVDKWKIRPSNLKKYLKPGSDRVKKFLLRNNLDTIVGINRILNDVIDDRVSMEKDGILTFESFRDKEEELLIDSLYKGIEKADIEMEKYIADHFDTNLGDIDVIDSAKHLFKVENWNKDINIVVYSNEEIELIKHNIIEHLYSKLNENELEIIKDVSINIADFVNKEQFIEKTNDIIDQEKLINCISDLLNGVYKKGDKYHIWVVE